MGYEMTAQRYYPLGATECAAEAIGLMLMEARDADGRRVADSFDVASLLDAARTAVESITGIPAIIGAVQ